MPVKIALRLAGLDLRDADAYERIPEELSELSFQANGGVSVAVVYADSPSPVVEAAGWASMIRKLIPGVRVVAAHDELVGVSDIAARCDVAAEAVRLWASGKRRAALRPFPAPREVVGSGSGGKSMKIYSWAEVVSWIREVIGVDPDEGIDYLDARQHAHLNAELADAAATAADNEAIAGPFGGSGWHSMKAAAGQVTTALSYSGPTTPARVAGGMAQFARIERLLVDIDPSPAHANQAMCR